MGPPRAEAGNGGVGGNAPTVKRFVDAHYVEVTVDSGRHMDQNLQVPAR